MQALMENQPVQVSSMEALLTDMSDVQTTV